MALSLATHVLLPDEKAYWLISTWQRTPLGDRRVERIWVLRNDQIVMHEEDKGPWDMTRDHPFQAAGLWLYSVAELREIAEVGAGMKAPDDDEHLGLLQVWFEELDERRMQAAHRSVSGRYQRKER